MNNAIWFTPLLLLPGVALLVMSTSARFGQVHGEIHHLMKRKEGGHNMPAHYLLKRSVLFRNALVGLYCAVGFLALASLLGGILEWFLGDSFLIFYWIVMFLTCLGILSLLFATVQLIRESIMALQVIKNHIDELDGKGAEKA